MMKVVVWFWFFFVFNNRTFCKSIRCDFARICFKNRWGEKKKKATTTRKKRGKKKNRTKNRRTISSVARIVTQKILSFFLPFLVKDFRLFPELRARVSGPAWDHLGQSRACLLSAPISGPSICFIPCFRPEPELCQCLHGKGLANPGHPHVWAWGNGEGYARPSPRMSQEASA